MATPNPSSNASPKWSSNAKLIVGLTLVAIIAILLQQFRVIIGPLLLSFVLAFLLHPSVSWLNKRLHIPWGLGVIFVFVVLIFILVGIFTLAGFAIVQQIQSLISTVQRFISQVPQLISDLSQQVINIGPFTLDLTRFDFTTVTNQLLASAQTVLGQIGGLVGTVATGTITTLGYVFFILLITYFLLVQGGQVREELFYFEIPGYSADIRRLMRELTHIWDAYLRSQVVIILMVIVVYYFLMTILGMRFTLGIALLAGLARLVPYVGPFLVWSTTALLAFFQPVNYLHLQPWAYTLLVIGLAILVDQVFDQYVQPRFMGQSLGVHPAAILVAAIIAFQWLGIIGLVLAAPTLATVTLFLRYVLRKMLDLDPWVTPERDNPVQLPHDRIIHRFRAWLRYIAHRFFNR